MGYDFELWEELNISLTSRISRRRFLQSLGVGTAAVAGAGLLAACGGPNPPHPQGGVVIPGSTVTSQPGAARPVTPYFLGYNNVPIHSPSWDNPQVVRAAMQMKPGTLRYPGGTVANYWDWQSGWFLPSAPSGFRSAPRSTYRLQELQVALQATGAQPVYVLNMLTSDLATQLQMLHTAKDMGLPVQFVELGNEFYLSTPNDYVTKFPRGSDYGKMATNWIRAIQAEFADVSIAVVGGAPSDGGDARKANWNQDVFQNLKGANAVTFHPYVGVQPGMVTLNAASDSVSKLAEAAATRWQDFESELQSLPPDLKVWITEYNFSGATDNLFRTWIHGVLVANMSLSFLEEERTELICYYDMIGNLGYEAIFTNWHGGSSSLAPYARTAAGWTLSLLGETTRGMTSVRRISLSSQTVSSDLLQGWIFSDGSHQQTFVVNSSGASLAWTPGSTFPQNARYQQLTSDPFKVITGQDSLTMNSGVVGSNLTLPPYSVTQIT